MNVIASKAVLVVCECGEHGRISMFFANGTGPFYGPEIDNRVSARLSAEALLLLDLISNVQFGEVTNQIFKSTLAEDEEVASILHAEGTEAWNAHVFQRRDPASGLDCDCGPERLHEHFDDGTLALESEMLEEGEGPIEIPSC